MEDNGPLVSVIVPVYKVEKYLSDCIKSIILQSYKNIEIIVINDGSPDHCGRIADEFALKDERIKVVHKENRGVAAARNTGLDVAKGEFVTFVDSDDWVACDYVEYLLKLQKINDADMCFTSLCYTSKNDIQEEQEIVETVTGEDAAVLLLSLKVIVGTWNKLYRRSWLVKNHIRQDERLYSGEGLHFIVMAAQYANHVNVGNRRIYYYRRNVIESATTKFNMMMFTNNELSLDLLEQNMVFKSKKIGMMILYFRVNVMIWGLLSILTCSEPTIYSNEYKRWRRQIWRLGKKVFTNPFVSLKSKIYILAVSVLPGYCARRMRKNREREYVNSI